MPVSLPPVRADVHPLFAYTRTQERVSRAVIGDDITGSVLPPAVLGNFFEHMSYATLGGASAELLLNPTLNRRHFLTDHQVEELRANARTVEDYFLSGGQSPAFDRHWVSSPLASGFGVTIFDNETSAGVPLAWAALGGPAQVAPAVGRLGGAVRLSGTPDVADQSSDTMAVGSGPSGVRQAVFLPVHRTLTVLTSIQARAVSPAGGTVEVGVLRRYDRPSGAGGAGTVLASTTQPVEGSAWQRIELTLELPAGVVEPGEPVDFYLRWHGPVGSDLLLDRVSALPDDHLEGFDPEVVEVMRRAAIPELRWPGGNFASFYHWRDGIGPLDDRPTYENRAWGGLEFHIIGTDEYLQLCRLTGAEPHITVNCGTAWAEEAAAWVEYCNGDVSTPMGALRGRLGHPEPYGVRIWEVGNENFGEWQGGNTGSIENARRFAEFAQQMRAASPSPLHILACGNWFDFAEPGPEYHMVTADRRWHAELLRQAPDDIDAISLHSLPVNDLFFDGCSDAEVNASLLAQVVTGERRFIPDLLRACDESDRGQSLPPITVAITEWGPLGQAPGRIMIENFGGVAWGGSFLNFVIRNCDRVTMTSPNGFMHGGAIKKGAGVVYTDPQFDLIQQYRPFVGGTPLHCSLTGPGYDVARGADLGAPEDDVPYLDVVACRSTTSPSEDALSIAVASRHQDETLPLQLSRRNGSFTCPARTSVMGPAPLDARADPSQPHRFPIEVTTTQAENGVLNIAVPPLSVVWLSVVVDRAVP
jgi:alpha-N-arabinofuranosidase